MEKYQATEPKAEQDVRADLVFPEHVARELERIGDHLAAPDPFHHAGLYAAQHNACWAAQPEAYASPVVAIMGNGEERECCSAQLRPPQS